MTADTKIRVSVVVFVGGADTGVSETLASLGRQSRLDDIEVIVADGTQDGSARAAIEGLPWARYIEIPGGNMPALKGKAVQSARGDIVAILDSHDVAAPDWIDQMIAAFEREDVAAVGGVVMPGGPSTAANWAAYLFEYGAFNPPVREGVSDEDLPGNNLGHRRTLLIGTCAEILDQEGFNKPFCHQRIRMDGGKMFMNPAMRVTHATSYRFLAFSVSRFHYGRCFGATRLRFSPSGRQAAYRVFAPIVPLILMVRHMARALAHPGNRRMLPRAGLALMGICLFWGVGEWIGYWFGQGRSCEKLR